MSSGPILTSWEELFAVSWPYTGSAGKLPPPVSIVFCGLHICEGWVTAIIPNALTYGVKYGKFSHPFQTYLFSLFYVQGLGICPVRMYSLVELTSLCVQKIYSKAIFYLSGPGLALNRNWTICRKISKTDFSDRIVKEALHWQNLILRMTVRLH